MWTAAQLATTPWTVSKKEWLLTKSLSHSDYSTHFESKISIDPTGSQLELKLTRAESSCSSFPTVKWSSSERYSTCSSSVLNVADSSVQIYVCPFWCLLAVVFTLLELLRWPFQQRLLNWKVNYDPLNGSSRISSSNRRSCVPNKSPIWR